MAMETELLRAEPPTFAYARMLRELEDLIGKGESNSEAAKAIRSQMDEPWYAMTAQEQDRLSGLSGDLYILKQGGPKRVDMSPEQIEQWYQGLKEAAANVDTGQVDAALEFLRQPIPPALRRDIIPFFQSRCWERLGDLETALVFMKEAERLHPDSLSIFWLLQRLGRVDDLAAAR